jgi:hypothetical protein
MRRTPTQQNRTPVAVSCGTTRNVPIVWKEAVLILGFRRLRRWGCVCACVRACDVRAAGLTEVRNLKTQFRRSDICQCLVRRMKLLGPITECVTGLWCCLVQWSSTWYAYPRSRSTHLTGYVQLKYGGTLVCECFARRAKIFNKC